MHDGIPSGVGVAMGGLSRFLFHVLFPVDRLRAHLTLSLDRIPEIDQFDSIFASFAFVDQ